MGFKPYKYQKQASAAMEKGRLDEALKWYDKAVAAEPRHPDLRNDRAVCLFHLGRKQAALDDLNTGVDLQPDYGYRYASRAYIKGAMKDIEGAIADYEKAIALDPEDAIALNNLGLLEEQQGRMQQAQAKFARADALQGLLKETGVDPAPIPEPRNIARELRQEAAENEAPGATVRTMLRALTRKEDWRAFVRFVRNGFRLPEGDK